MGSIRLKRRSLLQGAAITALATPFVRGAFAAGKLSVGFWDHWVPGANNTLTKLCQEWANKEKVEIAIDYITSQGDKLNLTQAAEAQARSGHDILTFMAWSAAAQTGNLEPVDDIMAPLIAQNGNISEGIEYVAKQDGHWIAVPSCVGSPTLPSCARIDLFKEHVGLDLTKMYPAGDPPDQQLADKWTWDFFLAAAEKCAKANHSFGLPLGVTDDPSPGSIPSSAAMELPSSIKRAISRSSRTPLGKCSNGSKSWRRRCRRTALPGTIRPTISS